MPKVIAVIDCERDNHWCIFWNTRGMGTKIQNLVSDVYIFSLGNRMEGDKEYIKVAAILTGRSFKMCYL